MIDKIDHIGIAVRGLGERLPFWAEALGLAVGGRERVDSEAVDVAFLPVGESRIELLEATDADSTIAKFIDRRGEGIHHLTLAVRDLDAVLERMAQHDVPVPGGARTGAGGSRVAFLHPKASGGVLIELVERRAADSSELTAGAPVLVYLREPQEKLWGVLRGLDGAGVTLRGIELGSFDEWVAQVERDEENVVGPSLLFIPSRRVDKVLLDEPSGELPSLSQRFEQRTGLRVEDVVG